MIKKLYFIAILIGVLVIAFISTNAAIDNQVISLSKASHAEELWATSGHADSTAEAFVHWDEDGEISSRCAKCHSRDGYIEFITTGSNTSNIPIGQTVECENCHSNKEQGIVRNHTDVEFPSEIVAEGLGPEALCMECHQGRSSGLDVESDIEEAGVGDDEISSSLGFINIHYFAAAATQFGTITSGGYEYAGNGYDARFSHVTGYNACTTCHNPHSLEVDLDPCLTCHTGVTNPKNIRFYGSITDYDGDGNRDEGIFYEIQGIKPKLYNTIKRYARRVLMAPIVYDSHAYPYFFHDLNNNGVADSSEANYGNKYSSFSPRLLRACYNYQVALKDPAGYAHGGKYIIQLLYDSIADLNSQLNDPISMAGMNRNDEGHFNGSAEAWRHWDEDEYMVSSRCAKCHSAKGLADYLDNGEIDAEETEASNGMLCTTCHTSPPALRRSASVKFPSGITRSMGDSSNLCMECHQGRASKYSIWDKIAGSPGPYRFTNIHYFPVAAILFGTEVKGGYEFGGKQYASQRLFTNHMDLFDTCVECHMGTNSPIKNKKNHSVHKPNPADCVNCHGQDVSQPNQGADPAKFKFSGIRPYSTPDYDGDNNITESIKYEIIGLEETLYQQIQIYAANIIGNPIIYDSHAYPYFFNDSNGNGIIDPGEAIYPNLYTNFDKKLLKASYNYQVSKKEPHGYIHNSRYVAQLLVDSIGHLGGDTTPYTWR